MAHLRVHARQPLALRCRFPYATHPRTLLQNQGEDGSRAREEHGALWLRTPPAPMAFFFFTLIERAPYDAGKMLTRNDRNLVLFVPREEDFCSMRKRKKYRVSRVALAELRNNFVYRLILKIHSDRYTS